MEGLFQCPANYVPLTPISFLERAAFVYGEKTSIIYGSSYICSWKQTYERCRTLAAALSHSNISRGDVVAAFLPNVPALYELHFGVPMVGGILSALNVSLDVQTLVLLLKQLEPKIMFVDYHYTSLFFEAMELLDLEGDRKSKLLLVVVSEADDRSTKSSGGEHPLGWIEYDNLLAMGSDDADFEITTPHDERDLISINFTSGSTGTPKAVAYSHRSVYLNSLGMIFRCEITKPPVFLWTVDMFRCNGWCFTWAMAALGGTNICLRENYTASPETILDLIVTHKVTHLFGKPILLNQLARVANPKPIPHAVDLFFSGPSPATQIIKTVREMGFNIKIGYGMTEVLGPAIIKPWDEEENGSSSSLEGVHNVMLEGVDVKDPHTMKSVPNDGATVGEVMFKGNTVMTGYYKNPGETERAFKDGWYRTRDIAVRQPSGHIQLKDRAVDMIVSRSDSVVSSLEVEEVLVSHEDVVEAAVVGCSDFYSGQQVPFAFVKTKDGCRVKEKEIIQFCAERLPGHMVPRTVVFGDLPKNSTGKIQKFVLRERAGAIGKFGHQNGHSHLL